MPLFVHFSHTLSYLFSFSRLQNSPCFCVFKYARAVKQKVWNEAENRERDLHALRACEARAPRARKTLTARLTDFFTDFEKKQTVLQSTLFRSLLNNNV